MKHYFVTITNIRTEKDAVAIANMVSDDMGYDAEVIEETTNN